MTEKEVSGTIFMIWRNLLVSVDSVTEQPFLVCNTGWLNKLGEFQVTFSSEGYMFGPFLQFLHWTVVMKLNTSYTLRLKILIILSAGLPLMPVCQWHSVNYNNWTVMDIFTYIIYSFGSHSRTDIWWAKTSCLNHKCPYNRYIELTWFY